MNVLIGLLEAQIASKLHRYIITDTITAGEILNFLLFAPNFKCACSQKEADSAPVYNPNNIKHMGFADVSVNRSRCHPNCLQLLGHRLVKSTSPSRPNKVGLKCPSARPYVRPFVRPQRVSSNLMKFGM